MKRNLPILVAIVTQPFLMWFALRVLGWDFLWSGIAAIVLMVIIATLIAKLTESKKS